MKREKMIWAVVVASAMGAATGSAAEAVKVSAMRLPPKSYVTLEFASIAPVLLVPRSR